MIPFIRNAQNRQIDSVETENKLVIASWGKGNRAVFWGCENILVFDSGDCYTT